MTGTEVPTHVENGSASPHAVFADIDGTPCDSHQRISGSALEALTQVRDRGHLLSAYAGRSAPEAYMHFWNVGFEGFADGAGGYASVEGRVPVDERMPHEYVGMLAVLWQELDASYIWQGPDQMGPSEGYLDFFAPRADRRSEGQIEYVQSITPLITDINSGTFTKVTTYVPPEKVSMERATAALLDGYRTIIDSVDAVGYVPFEVIPAHLSKTVGTHVIREHVGIPSSHTVAPGDPNNDVEAMATAAAGISIGGDCEVLVDAADIVAPSILEGGLAQALRATGLASDDPSGGQGLGDAR